MEQNKKGLCIFGGGLRAMSGAAAFISAALATEYNVTHQFTSSQDNKINYYDDAIRHLMDNFSFVSSNSGGSWFAYAMLMSSTFNDVMREMTQRYLEEKKKHLFRRNTAKENPFYHSFLEIALSNINKWNEEIFYTEEMSKYKEIQERFYDVLRKGTPVVGGDLALFLKHSFVEGNIWNSFVEILMSPLTQKAELPSWYQEIALEWFINVTLNLPKLGPLKTMDPTKEGSDTSKTRFQDHGSVLRFIRPDNTYLKYVSNCPKMTSLDPKYIGNYQKLADESFGRVDMVPAAFKVSSEKSAGLEYNFASSSLENLSLQYYIADNNGWDLLSENHIESIVENPSFNLIRQQPLQLNQTSDCTSDSDVRNAIEERNANKHKFRSWIRNSSVVNQSTSRNLQMALNEILYRVAASSAAAGETSNITPDWVIDRSGKAPPPKKQADLSCLLYLNPVSWIRGSLVDVIEDFDLSILCGSIDTLRNAYKNVVGLTIPQNQFEWELRGENLAEDCDRYLGDGKLLSYDTSKVEVPSNPVKKDSLNIPNSVPDHIKQKISLREYADLFPLNVSDGGCTDNTGIGRAVMERVSHISCLAFNTNDFLGLFENNDLSIYPLMYFDIFKCTKEEMVSLKKIISGEDLSDLDTKSIGKNFTFVSRKIFHQTKGQNRFLKNLFMCKFRNLSIKQNPYYLDLESEKASKYNVVKEISIIFALEQFPFGLMGGCLDENFTHYGTWIEEIHSALQNGFEEDGKNWKHYYPTLDDKISSANAFREFMF